MKHQMDLFGVALKAYAEGDRAPFFLKDSSGRLFETGLSRYFRSPDQISKLELKLISLAHGDILDVGCGTGNYLPLMAKRGRVLGIDISPKVIEVARMRGCRNCKVADIFTFRPKKRYDTVTFFGNGLGIGGTVNGTKRLLKKLSGMLKEGGQVLAIGRRVTRTDYVAVKLRPVWANRTGKVFGWIHISRDLLLDLCTQAGLVLTVVKGNQHYFLFRISKCNPTS